MPVTKLFNIHSARTERRHSIAYERRSRDQKDQGPEPSGVEDGCGYGSGSLTVGEGAIDSAESRQM